MNIYTWNIGESIPINLLVYDPDSGEGLTGRAGLITLTVQRADDLRFWNGSNWIATLTELSMAEIDSTEEKGRYEYVLPSTANQVASRFYAHAAINDPPTIVSDSYELHVSRDLTTSFYESEPV
jgi:hypothetical protein